MDLPLTRPPHRANDATILPLQIEVRQLPAHVLAVLHFKVHHGESSAGRDLILDREEVLRQVSSCAAARLVEKDVIGPGRVKPEVQSAKVFNDGRVSQCRCCGAAAPNQPPASSCTR